jgi:hypothetical protein
MTAGRPISNANTVKIVKVRQNAEPARAEVLENWNL